MINAISGANNYQAISIVQLSLNGEFIAEYETVSEGAKAINKTNPNIFKCLKGERMSAFGYLWIAKENYNDENVKKLVKIYNSKPPLNNVKGVVQLTKNGEFVAKYLSAQAGAEAVGGLSTNILKVCNGKHKSCKGYKWVYADDYIL